MLDSMRLATCIVLVWLAVSDVRSRRLPTRLVLLVAMLYFASAAATHASLPSVIRHVSVAAIALMLYAVCFRFGWLGGGDVKLAAAIFLWAGPMLALPVLFIVASSGLVLGLAMLTLRAWHGLRPMRSSGVPALFAPVRGVPYGIALSLGGIVAVWPSAIRFLFVH